MTIHLLDRNFVIEIRDYKPPVQVVAKKGVLLPPPVKNPTLDKARSFDKKNRTVSALLSIMEGDQAKVATASELAEILEQETKSLQRFYRLARTDQVYLQAHDLEACSALAIEAQRESSAYLGATAQLQAILAEQTGKQATKRPLAQVIEVARQHNLVLSNPLILCAIASIYLISPVAQPGIA